MPTFSNFHIPDHLCETTYTLHNVLEFCECKKELTPIHTNDTPKSIRLWGNNLADSSYKLLEIKSTRRWNTPAILRVWESIKFELAIYRLQRLLHIRARNISGQLQHILERQAHIFMFLSSRLQSPL
jgi:hypothetical protein